MQLLQGLQRILKGLLVDLLLILQSGLLGLGGVNGLLLLRLLLLQILVLFDGVRHFRFDAVEIALPLQKTRQNVLPEVRIAEGIRQGLQLLINFSFLIDILHIADLQGFIARQQLLCAALVFLLLLLLQGSLGPGLICGRRIVRDAGLRIRPHFHRIGLRPVLRLQSLMELVHGLLPDLSRISGAVDTRHWCRLVIAHPYCHGIVPGITAEPGVLRFVGGAGFSSAGHSIVQRQTVSRAVAFRNGPLQDIRHHEGRILPVNLGTGGLPAAGQLAVLLLDNFCHTGFAAVMAVVGQCSISPGHIHHPDTIGEAADGNRLRGGIHPAQSLEMHIGKILQPVLCAEVCQHLPGHRVQRPVHCLTKRHQTMIAAAGIAGTAVKFVVVDLGCRCVLSAVQRRGIVQQRLNGGAGLPHAEIGTVVLILGAAAAHHGHHIVRLVVDHRGCTLQRKLPVLLGIREALKGFIQLGLHLLLYGRIQRGVNFVAAGAEKIHIIIVGFLVLLIIACLGFLIRPEVLEFEVIHLHQGNGGAVKRIGAEVVLIRSLLGILRNTELRGTVGLVLILRDVAAVQHGFQHLVPLLQARLLVTYRLITGGGIGNSRQCRRLRYHQILGRLVEIVLTGRLHTVAVVAVEIGVAVQLHDLGLCIHFLQLPGQHHLHELPGEGSLRTEIGIFHHLLGDGGAALGDLSLVPDQLQQGTKGSLVVHAVVHLEVPVLLRNVGILQVHGNVVDVVIHEMSCIHDAQQLSVGVIDFRIRQLRQILHVHRRQLVVHRTLQLVILRLHHKNIQACSCDQKKQQQGRKDPPQNAPEGMLFSVSFSVAPCRCIPLRSRIFHKCSFLN